MMIDRSGKFQECEQHVLTFICLIPCKSPQRGLTKNKSNKNRASLKRSWMSFSGLCQLKALIPDLQDRLYKDLLLRLLPRWIDTILSRSTRLQEVAEVFLKCTGGVFQLQRKVHCQKHFDSMHSALLTIRQAPLQYGTAIVVTGHLDHVPCLLAFFFVQFLASFEDCHQLHISHTQGIYIQHFQQWRNPTFLAIFTRPFVFLLTFHDPKWGFLPQFHGISTSDDCTKILCNDLNQGFAVGRWSMFLVNVQLTSQQPRFR